MPKRTFIRPNAGRLPAVALVNPKYGHNVSGTLRNCAAFGIRQLWVTGDRVSREWETRGRLPREERMRGYGTVEVAFGNYFFDAFKGMPVTPVAVEVRQNAEPLTMFTHPLNALYVFGPEDGTLGRSILGQCHRFIIIPSDHCLNLAVATGIVLAHRRMTLQLEGDEEFRASYQTMKEERGFADGDNPFQWAS